MPRLLRMLLLFGAVIGLLGQEAAYAIGPSFAMTATASSVASMSPECAEMMKQQTPDTSPCKGLTLDCVAKMGCSIPMAVGESAPEPRTFFAESTVAVATRYAPLADRTILPDKQPPKLLT
ncbi:hypothetical protein [Novosphingobium sp.]|uniref:hypothetical protein n=1 Tax=Novosphingobium sp. TaxID=1874826 RepID=UPI0025F4DBBB|nr:hypothetical protein [Novosphingobium sp.]